MRNMLGMMKTALTLSLAMLLLAGCHRGAEHIPTYGDVDNTTALRILADRASAIHTVSAQGSVTLTRPTGQFVRMDAALAIQSPDRLRLRAWKFSQAVFDLTLTDQGLWLFTPQDPSLKKKIQSAGVGAADFAKTWALLSGPFFQRSDLRVVRDRPLTLSAPANSNHQIVLCDIDRPTLTPRRYRLLDPQGKSRFTLLLDHYVDHGNGLVYPHHMLATSDAGKVEIDLAEVDLNTDLPPNAFKPPRRAEKLP